MYVAVVVFKKLMCRFIARALLSNAAGGADSRASLARAIRHDGVPHSAGPVRHHRIAALRHRSGQRPARHRLVARARRAARASSLARQSGDGSVHGHVAGVSHRAVGTDRLELLARLVDDAARDERVLSRDAVRQHVLSVRAQLGVVLCRRTVSRLLFSKR
jgi:hypothetical protein